MGSKTIQIVFLALFVGSSQAVKFSCTFAWTEPTTPVVGKVFCCDTSVSYYGSGSTELTAVEGYQWATNIYHVEYLTVVRENLSFVPQNIDLFMPNIRSIMFKNGNLNKISAEDLRQFPQLEVLSITYNRLVSIDGNLFMDTPYLRHISFEGNAIRNVGQDLVTYLYDLEYLSFRRNLCVNREAATPEAIMTLGMQLPAVCPPLGQPALTTIPASTIPLEVSPFVSCFPVQKQFN